MKKLFSYVLALGLILGLSGCSYNRAYKEWSIDPYIQKTFNESINDIANQLLKNSRVNATDKIAITTFVDLHKLNRTTYFGRKLSESMFNELHVRGFNIIDIRGSKTIRVNADGEFFITRDIKLLKGKKL